MHDALCTIEKNAPDFALLDINLGKENSIPVALKLKQFGIPFATGYGERAPLPPNLTDVRVVQKPYMPEALIAAMPQRTTNLTRPHLTAGVLRSICCIAGRPALPLYSQGRPCQFEVRSCRG